MKPGLRLTYFQGAATVAASRYNLVPAANGGWTNTATGQSLGCAETMNTGGAAYNQLTIVDANQQALAAESRLFMISDPQNDRVTSGKFGSIIGTPDGLGGTTGCPRPNLPPCRKRATASPPWCA